MQVEQVLPVGCYRLLNRLNENIYSRLFECEGEELAVMAQVLAQAQRLFPVDSEGKAWHLAAMLKLVDLYLWEIDTRSFGSREDSTFMSTIGEGQLFATMLRMLGLPFDFKRAADCELSIIAMEIVNALCSINPTNLYFIEESGLLAAVFKVCHPSQLETYEQVREMIQVYYNASRLGGSAKALASSLGLQKALLARLFFDPRVYIQPNMNWVSGNASLENEIRNKIFEDIQDFSIMGDIFKMH